MLIRKMRIENGWSQETLAEISGLSVRTVQRIERGASASLDSLGALASAFEVDIATLATEKSMYEQKELSSKEKRAVEHARDLKGFYSHVAIYLVSVVAMAAVNFYMGIENLWFVWPAVGWGFGVLFHGLAVFEIVSLYGAEWELRQIRRILGEQN